MAEYRCGTFWSGLLITALLVGLNTASTAAQESARVEWMPFHKMVPGLRADPLEPRISVEKAIGTTQINARVGGLWDVVAVDLAEPLLGFTRFSGGMSGMAHMLLDMHFFGSKSPLSFPFGFSQQVRYDLWSGDYSFGIHASAIQPMDRLGVRYRVSFVHLSAHMGDNRYDEATRMWMEDLSPIHYSRNYWQLLVDGQTDFGFRPYAQVSYITFQSRIEPRPARLFANAGLEFETPIHRIAAAFAAADVRTFSAEGDDGLSLGVNLKAGISLMHTNRRGISFHISRYTGPDWRGQFRNRPTEEWSAGITVIVG